MSCPAAFDLFAVELTFTASVLKCRTIKQRSNPMMFVIFLFMFLALALGLFGWRTLALICVALSLGLAAKEFLWEIHSAEYGYSMPWLDL